MSWFLTGETVDEALHRLRASNARARLCEFLIGVRTLTLAEADEVHIAESEDAYIKAVDELARCVPLDFQSRYRGKPFYTPFGSQAAYKSPKYPSNGPSNTIHGWANQVDRPFEILPTRPKSIRRRDVTKGQLRNFLLLKGGRDLSQRPRLLDAAIWYFRAEGVSLPDGTQPTRENLEESFVSRIGLSTVDVQAIFRSAAEDTDEIFGDI